MRKIAGIVVVLLSMFQIALGEPSRQVEIKISATTEWVSLSRTSALRIRRAVSPSTNEPIGPLPEFSTLSREFYLPSRRLVLGEPLLVEYRVSDTRESAWREPVGGRYRGSGRDDNFEFYLQHEDGTWVPDPYGKTMDMGGLSTSRKVGPSQDFSYWHPVQRWSALTRTGRYRLFCLRWAANHRVRDRDAALNEALPTEFRFDPNKGVLNSKTGKPVERGTVDWRVLQGSIPKSPVVIPQALSDEMERRGGSSDQPATFAEFEVVVVSGRPDVQGWKKQAEAKNTSWPDNRATAARLGLWYLPQISQLPILRSWLQKPETRELTGLSMNPHREAIELLLTAPPELVLNSLHRLREEHRVMVEPWLLNHLNSGDSSLRKRAAAILEQWGSL